MAFQSSPVLDFSFKAAEDLSNYQYHFIIIDSNGKVALMNAIGDYPIGVLQNAPGADEEATVRILGISKVVANAAIDEGSLVNAEFVSTSDCGKAQATTTDNVTCCGIVLGASGAEDDLASVLLTPLGSKPVAKA
ncbi:MAG: hypothetical protein A2Y25_12000 [Candidatus Melainabacteria bacterium GWF2_37_15]|nr:MAG: hypothetical protein A2Y25_12000 [Candidatus Melainabacteria bacterium GWF2_37_15]